jgi:hypothetical protein
MSKEFYGFDDDDFAVPYRRSWLPNVGFHFHWNPAPRFFFFQLSGGGGQWHIRISHAQWDVRFPAYYRGLMSPED